VIPFQRFILGALLACANLVGCSPQWGEASWLTGKSAQELQLRAIWVQCDAANTPEQADDMLDRVVQGKFNTVLYCVGSGTVTYNSSLLNRGPYVTPEYDPLAYVVEQGHARGLKVQAWWCPGLIMEYGSLRNEHPEWDIAAVEGIPNDFHWPKFSLPEVRQFVGDVAVEIVENYDVDGVHLDYIRYPWPPSDVDLHQFFGPEDVPATVQGIYQRVKAIQPDVQVTAAVTHRQSRSAYYMQNWADWLEGEYIDYVMPMAYFSPDENDSLEYYFGEWQALPHFERIVPGLSVVTDFESKAPKTPEQLIAQIAICRAGGARGITIFDENMITGELLDALAAGPFAP
jgi:uncharacterized lipoprotein YddW (UPF0748 family)